MDYLGLFYVIEGFLDILLPIKEKSKEEATLQKTPHPRQESTDSEPWRTPSTGAAKPEQKLLFTVKPGGIAGYLGQSLSTQTMSLKLTMVLQPRYAIRRPMLISRRKLIPTLDSYHYMLWSASWRSDPLCY